MYRNVHFRIEAGYVWGEGMSENASKAFHDEINQLFINAGWEIIPPRFSSACPDAAKGKSKLYLHPMDVSGAIDEALIDEVKQILDKGRTFTCYHVDVYEEVYDWTDEEYTVWLDERKESIKKDLLDMFRTKRRNLFVTRDYAVIQTVKEKYHVHRLDSFVGRSTNDVEWRYVQTMFDEMVQDGCFTIAQTKNGTGYRTVVGCK